MSGRLPVAGTVLVWLNARKRAWTVLEGVLGKPTVRGKQA